MFSMLVALIIAGVHSASSSSLNVSQFSARAFYLADILATCQFDPLIGLFNDLVWQSGSTLETLSDVMTQTTVIPARWADVLSVMFVKTPAVVDHCFDDHQWFLLGWVRAYESTGNISYVQRASVIFDYIAVNGWDATLCGGGVTWCPPPTGPYKNAITTELFISSAMALQPYESILNRTNGFYVTWAAKAWNWLEKSNMLNSQSLFNDGLITQSCLPNGQTTWTYNQGVILSGLGRLSIATGNETLMQIANSIAHAAMTQLSVDGILTEPCPGGDCGGDGRIFKGVFVRHLGYLASISPLIAVEATDFLAKNARALIRNGGGGCNFSGATFPFRWDGPCDSDADTATTSSALDVIAAAAKMSQAPSDSQFTPLGLGNCADSNGKGMGNCYNSAIIDERACRDAAWTTMGAVAYDFSISTCLGANFCRVRTIAGSNACTAGGWSWDPSDNATVITTTVDSLRTLCVMMNNITTTAVAVL